MSVPRKSAPRRSSVSEKAKSTSAPKNRKVALAYEAPEAESVSVTGTFCDWKVDTHKLTRDGNGVWKKTLTLTPGTYEYRFVVDGEWADDPSCNDCVSNVFGTHNCLLQV